MADERNDTGGSSAGESIRERWNKLFRWAMKKKTDEQSGTPEIQARVDQETEGERALRVWISMDDSESEPEVRHSEPSVRPGQVNEWMLRMLGVGSYGSGSDSNGSSRSVENFGIETNIEGLIDDLREIVPVESCAADSPEGVAEKVEEGDEEEESLMNSSSSESEFESAGMNFKQLVSLVFSVAGHRLLLVLRKVCCCADVLLHYYPKGF